MAALWFRKELTGRACKELWRASLWQSWDASLGRDSFEIEVKVSYLHGNSDQIWDWLGVEGDMGGTKTEKKRAVFDIQQHCYTAADPSQH